MLCLGSLGSHAYLTILVMGWTGRWHGPISSRVPLLKFQGKVLTSEHTGLEHGLGQRGEWRVKKQTCPHPLCPISDLDFHTRENGGLVFDSFSSCVAVRRGEIKVDKGRCAPDTPLSTLNTNHNPLKGMFSDFEIYLLI